MSSVRFPYNIKESIEIILTYENKLLQNQAGKRRARKSVLLGLLLQKHPQLGDCRKTGLFNSESGRLTGQQQHSVGFVRAPLDEHPSGWLHDKIRN